ncbi:MAG: OmpA family protein [Bacteroidetes bacterium]|nr:OmpA family protein [Bacteroidota bacterium]
MIAASSQVHGQDKSDYEAINKTERKALKKAVKALKVDDYYGAMLELEKAYAENPSSPFTMYWLGKSYYEIRQPGKAWPLVSDMVRINPSYHPELPYLYARLSHIRGNLEEALVYYKKALVNYEQSDAKLYESVKNYIKQCENARSMRQDTLQVDVRNLGREINTPMPDYAAIVTPNDSLMFFTSRRWENLGGLAVDDLPFEDVYMSKLGSDGKWTAAQNLGPEVNHRFHDGSNAISPSGDKVYLYRSKDGGGIFVGDIKDNALQRPIRNIGKPIKSKYYEPSASLNEDGGVLFFVREAPGGYGGLDLYWSHRDAAGNWQPGKNLGPVVNTPFDDDAPYMWADGKTLFFASKGHDGYGGYDIFKTVLQSDSTWSKPVNLGYPINSTGDDVYFVLLPDSTTGYFTSDRITGMGDKDIYRFTPSIPPVLANNIPSLCGTLLDSLQRVPIGGEIRLVHHISRDTVAILHPEDADGYFAADSLIPGQTYDILAESNGYFTKIDQVTISETPGECTRKVVELVQLKVGDTFVINNVFFDFDKASLRPISQNALDNLKQLMQEIPSLKITVHGHTDHVGSDQYNLTLSDARARSVANYLITEGGIARERLSWKGHGESKPIVECKGDLNRQKNRRVEIEVTAIDKPGVKILVDTTTRHCFVNANNYGDIPGVQHLNYVSGKVLGPGNKPLAARLRVYDPELNLIVLNGKTNPGTGYYSFMLSPGVKYRIEAKTDNMDAEILDVIMPKQLTPVHTTLNFILGERLSSAQ